MILRQKDKLSNAYLLFTAAGWARTNREKNRTHMHTEAPTSDPPTQFLLAGSLSMHGARSTLPNLLHRSAHISLALPCSNRILHSLTFTISSNIIYNTHIAVFSEYKHFCNAIDTFALLLFHPRRAPSQLFTLHKSPRRWCLHCYNEYP